MLASLCGTSREDTILAALSAAHAGWKECAPNHPSSWDEVDPATHEVKARVARMDQYGISAQVLYPNVAMFASVGLQSTSDIDLQNALIRAYNEWQMDWCSYAPSRFAPMISVPFWDLDETLREIDRCTELGFKGIIFTQDPTAFGLPALVAAHWDDLWSSAQERGLSINFHIGASKDAEQHQATVRRQTGGRVYNKATTSAQASAVSFLANARTISELILGGICHRFPALDFVSVESGAGYIKFLLEALDWQWQNTGLELQNSDHLLPSEYFKRQIYGTFWFERESARSAIESLGSENLMYETDFPHPTSMSPGPGCQQPFHHQTLLTRYWEISRRTPSEMCCIEMQRGSIDSKQSL